MEIRSFVLENLEGRTLLSGVAAMDAAPESASSEVLATAEVRAASHPLSAAFNATGTFTKPFHNPDVGPSYDFTGHGTKTSLGKFKLTGHVQTPGFVNNGRSSGKLVLTSSRGTITLILHGPPQAPGTLPPSFTYSIRKGTGKYANSTGKGHFTVSASETTHRFVFRFNPPA
jgi:hypothetical protein